jgi:hypothetical protein
MQESQLISHTHSISHLLFLHDEKNKKIKQFVSRYQWQLGAWSQCRLDVRYRLDGPGRSEALGGPPAELGRRGDDEEEEACGPGIRHRNLTCLDTRAGTPSPFHLCLQGPVVFANQLIER